MESHKGGKAWDTEPWRKTAAAGGMAEVEGWGGALGGASPINTVAASSHPGFIPPCTHNGFKI